MAKSDKDQMLFGVKNPRFVFAQGVNNDGTEVELSLVPNPCTVHRKVIMGRQIAPDVHELMMDKIAVGFLVKDHSMIHDQESFQKTLSSFQPYAGTYRFKWVEWREGK